MHVDNFHMCLFWQLTCSYAFSICHIHDSSGTAQTNLSLHITPAIDMASGSKPVLPATVVQEVNAIMDSTKPVNHKVDLIVNLLHQHGLARSQQLKPNDFLCRPSNRANLMLNHHDVWKKGMAMLQVGMKRSFLGEAMAFELSMDPTKKAAQLDQNQAMLTRSEGCLAPINGMESTLSNIFPHLPSTMQHIEFMLSNTPCVLPDAQAT